VEEEEEKGDREACMAAVGEGLGTANGVVIEVVAVRGEGPRTFSMMFRL